MLTRADNAKYRPLVKRAWLAHCRRINADPKDKIAYDAWYRNVLKSTCGIRSTKDATREHYNRLISTFRQLVDAVQPFTVRGLSPGQSEHLTALAQDAWAAARARGQVPVGEPFTNWIVRQLADCGINYRFGFTNRTTEFDDVMAHLAVIAGDRFWINRTSEAAEIRMRYVIQQRMDELSALQQEPVDWNYCRAIYNHMNLPLSIEDAPAQLLWKILQALDTHVRRLRKRSGTAWGVQAGEQVEGLSSPPTDRCYQHRPPCQGCPPTRHSLNDGRLSERNRDEKPPLLPGR